MTRRKTLADLAYTASERYVRFRYGKGWRDKGDHVFTATEATAFFDGYLTGRRAERRAAKRRDG